MQNRNEGTANKTTPYPKTQIDLLWRIACAIHNADEPLTDWADLPHEDTAFGTGKRIAIAFAGEIERALTHAEELDDAG